MPDETGAFGVETGATPDSDVSTNAETTTPTETAPTEQSTGGTEGAADEAAAQALAWEFKFGPKHFKSPDEATQYFSTWNGRITRADKERDQALEALNEWDNWYKSNREKIDGALTGPRRNAAESKTETPDQPADLMDGISWDYVNELLQSGRTADAQKYVAWKTGEILKSQLSTVRDELRNEFRSTLAPMQETNAVREMSTQVLLAAMAARDADHPDVPRFPEFQEGTETFNPEFVKAFGQIWRSMDVKMALDTNLHGVELAYWRTKNAFVGRATEAGDKIEEAVNQEQDKFRRNTATRANAVGASPVPTKTVPGKPMSAIDKFMGSVGKAPGRSEVFGTRRRE